MAVNISDIQLKYLSESSQSKIFVFNISSTANETDIKRKLHSFLDVEEVGGIYECSSDDINSNTIKPYPFIIYNNMQKDSFQTLCFKLNNGNTLIYWFDAMYEGDTYKFYLRKLFNPKLYLPLALSEVIIHMDIKKYLCENKFDNDQFVFSDTNEVELIKLLAFNQDEVAKQKQFEINCKDENKIIFSPHKEVPKSLKRNTHYLRIVEINNQKQIVWIKTDGTQKNIFKYQHYDRCISISEDDLMTRINDQNLFLVCDDTGTGKSNLLGKIAQKKAVDSLVIFIRLGDCGAAIKKNLVHNKKNLQLGQVVDFLTEANALSPNKVLEKQTLLSKISNKDIDMPLVLLFDGFNEIQDSDQNVSLVNKDAVINLIQFLQGKAIIVIGAGSREKGILQKHLQVFVHRLIRPTTKQKEEYLEAFRSGLRIRDYRGQPSDLIKASQNYIIPGWIQTPLDLRLYAEYINGVESENAAALSNIISATNLEFIALYIDQKYMMWQKKNKISYLTNKCDTEYLTSLYKKRHSILAFLQLFSNCKLLLKTLELTPSMQKTLNIMIDNGNIKIDVTTIASLSDIGLLRPSSNALGYKFMYSLFAEYSAAALIVEWLQFDPQLLQTDSDTIAPKIVDFLLTNVFVPECSPFIKGYVNSKIETSALVINSCDIQKCSSALYTALQDNHKNIFRFILRIIKNIDEQKFYNLLTVKNIINTEPLFTPFDHQNYEIIKLILSELSTLSKDKVFKIFRVRNKSQRTLLHLFVQLTDHDIFKSTITMLQERDCKELLELYKLQDENGDTVLHTASSYLNKVHGTNIDKLNDFRQNISSSLSDETYQDPTCELKYDNLARIFNTMLANTKDKDIIFQVLNIRNKQDIMVPHMIVDSNRINATKLLLEICKKHCIKLSTLLNKKNATILHVAVRSNNTIEVAKLILEHLEETDELKALLQFKSNSEIDHWGTPIHTAAYNVTYEILLTLLDKYIKHNILISKLLSKHTTNDGATAFHLLLQGIFKQKDNNNLNEIAEVVLKTYIDRKKDDCLPLLKVTNKNWGPLLHAAVDFNNIHMTKVLLGIYRGCDIKISKLLNARKLTALHIAVTTTKNCNSTQREEVITLLLEREREYNDLKDLLRAFEPAQTKLKNGTVKSLILKYRN